MRGLGFLADRPSPLLYLVRNTNERSAMSTENKNPDENKNVWTLDAMNDELAKRYAPLVFTAEGTEYTLVSLMRLSKADRKAVAKELEKIDTSDEAKEEEYDEDVITAAVEFIIKKVTKDGKGTALVKLMNGDMAMLMLLINRWAEATQPGEASDSES